LSGGGSKKENAAEKAKEVQTRQEKENKIPMVIKKEELQNEDMMGISHDPDEPDADKDGRYGNLNRDYTDWGVYTTTGAQISASEVEEILVLSDVYGPFSNDNKLLCDRIAFECQPCVVMSPDKQDAEELKYLLEHNNDNIVDYVIKIYPNQEHGFARQEQLHTAKPKASLSEYYIDPNIMDDETGEELSSSTTSPEKESAFLLSTAWIETYTRLFLPTVGALFKDEESDWSTNIEMKDLNYFHDYYEEDENEEHVVDENMNMNIRDKIRSKIEKEIKEHTIDDDNLDYSDVRMQQW